MTMPWFCTWCGARVPDEDVTADGLSAIGTCPEDDGIVYVTADPEEVM